MIRFNLVIFLIAILLLTFAFLIYDNGSVNDVDKNSLDSYITSLNIEVGDTEALEREIENLYLTGKIRDFIRYNYYIMVGLFTISLSMFFYVFHLSIDRLFFYKNVYLPPRVGLAIRRSFLIFLISVLYFANRLILLPREVNVGILLILFTIEIFLSTGYFFETPNSELDKTYPEIETGV
jgi:hypothetical protein